MGDSAAVGVGAVSMWLAEDDVVVVVGVVMNRVSVGCCAFPC